MEKSGKRNQMKKYKFTDEYKTFLNMIFVDYETPRTVAQGTWKLLGNDAKEIRNWHSDKYWLMNTIFYIIKGK